MGKGKESDPTDESVDTSANASVDRRPTDGRQTADCRPTVSRHVGHSLASENVSSVKELLAKNNIMAIASGDPGEEYYLLKVTGNGPEI